MQILLKIVLTTVVTALDGWTVVAFLMRVRVTRRHSRRLFLQLFTLSAAAFYLFSCIPTTDAAAHLQADHISPLDVYTIGVLKLAANLLYGDHHRWWLRLAYLLSGVALAVLTYTANAFAAVGWHSRECHTLSSFLHKVKGSLLRPALTAAGVCALRAAAVAAVAGLIVPITGPKYIICTGMFLVTILNCVLQAVCALAVVASVAEPGLCGKGALARARRLTRGKYWQALDPLASSGTLRRTSWLLYTIVAMAGLPASGTIKCLILIAEDMIFVANVTGYYFECRNREELEDKAWHGY